MPQLLPLSRAARLVGVSRGELQSRIRRNELVTFEGMIKVSDLLRVFPEVKLQDDSALERAELIKSMAAPRSELEKKLPSAQVLVTRVTELSRDLTESRSEISHYADIFKELDDRLAQMRHMDSTELPQQIEHVYNWLREKISHTPKIPKRKTELLARDTFLRMVEARVKLIPSGHEYFVEGTDTLLESGLRSGYALRYGCTQGSCSKCKARVISGEVLRVRDHEYEITETERNMGYILMCSYTAVTDLVIEADEARSNRDIPLQEIETRVRKLDRPDHDTAILYVQTASTNSLRFLAGQTARLMLPSGKSCTLALASCPCDGSHLEFHVRRYPENGFSNEILDQGIAKDTIVNLSGPMGDSVLQVDSTRPVLFIAYGDGFATIKSLIESAISIDDAESYHLYWIAPEEGKHYLQNRCRSWSDALDNFQYTSLVLSQTGNQEKIQEAFKKTIIELPDIARYDVYISAPGTIIDAVGDLMKTQGLDPLQFVSCDMDLMNG